MVEVIAGKKLIPWINSNLQELAIKGMVGFKRKLDPIV
jgi:hypothetical protein